MINNLNTFFRAMFLLPVIGGQWSVRHIEDCTRKSSLEKADSTLTSASLCSVSMRVPMRGNTRTANQRIHAYKNWLRPKKKIFFKPWILTMDMYFGSYLCKEHYFRGLRHLTDSRKHNQLQIQHFWEKLHTVSM